MKITRGNQDPTTTQAPPRWIAPIAAAAFLLFGVVGILLSWPLISGYGSTPAEQRAVYPGDSPSGPPAYRATWAITIDAPPAKVWPWVVQMGADRAAFYSYDWAENLTAVNYHNGTRIVPAWQHAAVGDTVRAVPVGYAGGLMDKTPGWKVLAREEQHAFAIDYGTWHLTALPGDRTRLVLRYRGSTFSPLMVPIDAGVGMPIHFLMGRRDLLGIAERATGVPYTSPIVELLARLGWAFAAVGALLVLVRRPRGWAWVVAALPWPALVLWTSGDWRSAAAAFLVVAGMAAVGSLAPRGWRLAAVLGAVAVVLVTLMLAPDGRIVLGLAGFVGLPLATVLAWGRASEAREGRADRPALATDER